MSTSGKDSTPGNLSMEQQFKLKVVQDQVKGLSLEQAQELPNTKHCRLDLNAESARRKAMAAPPAGAPVIS